VGDPVASGIVARLNQPSGNVTGFGTFEATLGGKWLELLSETLKLHSVASDLFLDWRCHVSLAIMCISWNLL
jgi:hypothetical protein